MQSQKALPGFFGAENIKGILLLLLVLALTLIHSGCVGLAGSSSLPLSLSNPAPGSVSSTWAMVDWTTNIPATSQVEYGTTTNYGLNTSFDPTLVNSHAQALTALSAATTYHYRVHSKDSAGIEAVSGDFTLTTAAIPDTTPPTVAITLPASAATLSGQVSVAAVATDNVGVVGVQFKVDGNNTGAEVLAAPYTYSLNTTTLSNASHSLTAVARDAAGNSTTSAAVSVNVNNTVADTTPPTVSITAPIAGATVSGSVSVSANATDNVGVVGVQFKVDGANIGSEDLSSPYSISWSTTGSSNGSHTLTAVARDAAGNSTTSAAVSVNVNNTVADTTPPTVSITAPIAGATVSGSVSVSANATDNVGVVGVQFKVDGNNTGAEVLAAPYTYSLNTATLSNASHSLTAVARDAAGNSTTSAAVSVNVNNTVADTTPPTVSVTAPIAGATVSGSVSVSANATDNVGVVGVQFKVDGNNTGAEVLAAPYTYSLNTTTLSNASHSLTAVARDAAGNSTTSAAVSVNVNNTVADTTPPSVPSGLSATPASSTQINLSWNASTDNVGVAGYKVFRSGAQVGTSSSTSYEDVGLTPSSTYSYAISAYDAAGNQSAQSPALSVTTQAQSGGGIPSGLGWFQAPSSKVQSVCPPNDSNYAFSDNCRNVVNAWSGGIADTKRNRLLIFGGGHTDYSGNEVYAFDPNALTLTRLYSPTEPVSQPSSTSCPTTLGDGKPNSRHTYGGLAYIASVDKMFVFGGSVACAPGNAGGDTWTLDLSTLAWHRQDPVNGAGPSDNLNSSADYDPNTQLVFLNDRSHLWSYNYGTNTYTQLASMPLGLDTNSVIDPKRKLFFSVGQKDPGLGGGPGLYVVSIAAGSTYTVQDWTGQTSGCTGFMDSHDYAVGLAYDSVQDRIIGWADANGNTVYVFNPDTKTCTTQNFSGGPAANSGSRGTYGRFKYFASLGVFALVSDTSQNAFTLRLTSSSGSTDTTPPTVSITAPTGGAVVSGAITVSASASDNVGVVGVQFKVDGVNLGAEVLSSPYSTSLNTATLSNASHSLTAVARDAAGNTATSAVVSITVANATGDLTPPTVSIASPISGATVSATVAVSANASDNVGVVGVQFLLDGANLGAEDTSSPYSVAWDTTTSVNGLHTLTARARDAAGNMATSTAVTLTVSNSTSTSNADADYAARCGAAGVVRCIAFDSPAVIAGVYGDNTGVLPSDNPAFPPVIDPSVKASGTGSLLFTIPSQIGTNMGSYFANFSSDLSVQFDSGGEFWVQWRQRFSPELLSTVYTNSNGFKQVIVGEGDRPSFVASSCTDMHLVVENTFQRGVAQMYHSCGYKDGQYEGLDRYNVAVPNNTDVQPNLGCNHNTAPAAPCFSYQSNQWMTFQMHVKVGTWYTNNGVYKHDTTVQLYAANEGQPSVLINQFTRVGDATCDATQVSIPAGCTTGYDLANSNPGVAKYGKIWLLPYQTGKDATQVTPVAYTWYDELIISRQKIPDPKF